MNFTLTPGVYAALNLLSKSTRSKVLEAAFAFVICGVRPTNLSKNLLVMFMMVVDSATGGQLTYVPEQEAEKAETAVVTEPERPATSEAVTTTPADAPEANKYYDSANNPTPTAAPADNRLSAKNSTPALKHSLEYLYEDEQTSFQECNYPKDHVFRVLKRL